MKHLAIFLAAALIDAFWVATVHYTQREKPVHTALASMCLALLSWAGYTSTISDWHLLFAYIGGMGFGSFMAVKYGKYIEALF